jgi:DNA-binding transcriptional LysR family regulator
LPGDTGKEVSLTQKELLYITTIAQVGSISKAAEKLYVTQPSLSRCIQKLEADLGTELFKRTPDGLKVTAAGECYTASAQVILQTYKEMEIRISHLNQLQAGRLTVGTTVFLGSIVLPRIIRVFAELYPNIEIRIVEGVSIEIENMIFRGAVDLGILHGPLLTEGIASHVFSNERFLLAVPPGDALNSCAYQPDYTGEKYLDVRLAANRNFILTHSSQRSRQVSDALLGRANIQPNCKYTTKSIQTAIRLVHAGLGLTFVPQSYCSLFGQEYSPNYYFIEPEYKPTWQLAVCYSQEMPLSKPAEEVIRICRETLP